MTLRILRTPAAIMFGAMLLAGSTWAQTKAAANQSAYGGDTVEDIVVRVNDQIITRSDYDRAMKELDDESRQHGATSMQEISAGHKDLLRNLIDQQLWLSKGKELGINGETELIKKLDEIRKQYNLETLEDLEKAAKEQGVSFEDFKANIRNQIITQEVMRNVIRVNFTPGEAQRYFDQHKQDYAQPESLRLSEILVSTGTPAPDVAGGTQPDDPQKLAAAKAKADDIEAKLHAGGDFAELAKSFSDGPTAAQGGDIGQFKRGSFAPVLEDKAFALKTGEFTEPVRTRQGFLIMKAVEHVPGGPPQYKDVEQQVEENLYMSRMEPAIRVELNKMREEAYIDIKQGYVDTGATPNETKPVFSAYTPPAPKKKKKVERTRFRETTHTFRQKTAADAPAEAAATPPPAPTKKSKKQKATPVNLTTMKPGKKEKIRYGQAPKETLPQAAGSTKVEDAGALPETAANNEPANPLEATKQEQKTRFSDRAKLPKKPKAKGPQLDDLAPAPPDAAEVADRQTQSGPLGENGDTASKKKKKATTTGDKTRLADKKGQEAPKQTPEMTPAPVVPGAPAPASANQPPAPAPQAPAPAAQQ